MKKSLFLLLLLGMVLGCGSHDSTMSPMPPPPKPTVTGHWIGTGISTVFGSSFPLSADFVQGTTNADSTINFSGSVNVGGCVNLVTITGGLISGNSFALSGGVTDGGTLTVTATLNSSFTALNGNYKQIGGLVCPSDAGTFSMTKQ